jgi:hypothetical protein
VEGYFIAIARYISGHWGDFSWFPLWHCGMPYQDTYVPCQVFRVLRPLHVELDRVFAVAVSSVVALETGNRNTERCQRMNS